MKFLNKISYVEVEDKRYGIYLTGNNLKRERKEPQFLKTLLKHKEEEIKKLLKKVKLWIRSQRLPRSERRKKKLENLKLMRNVQIVNNNLSWIWKRMSLWELWDEY